MSDWLDYQQKLHLDAIALGLDRVDRVWQSLGAPRPARQIIAVAGTNGKGSTVAFIESLARAAGWRVGCYTSPHLLHYNERIRLDGDDIADDVLTAAFERVEAARGAESLTYFEFGTLAALLIFSEAELDLAVLEVGLGGRLDAVNIIDADVAVITSIALDHQVLLGDTRDLIGAEKAGIARAGKPVIVADPDPPQGLIEALASIGADMHLIAREFDSKATATGSTLQRPGLAVGLPPLQLLGAHQHRNAAAALVALKALPAPPALAGNEIAGALHSSVVPGRCQWFEIEGRRVLIDVAHNPAGAQALAAVLGEKPLGTRRFALFAALTDKDLPGLVEPLLSVVDHWFLVGLANEPRGLSAHDTAARLADILPPNTTSLAETVIAAIAGALAHLAPGDQLIIYGSFLTAAQALRSVASEMTSSNAAGG